jgi:hypothetical protein
MITMTRKSAFVVLVALFAVLFSLAEAKATDISIPLGKYGKLEIYVEKAWFGPYLISRACWAIIDPNSSHVSDYGCGPWTSNGYPL